MWWEKFGVCAFMYWTDVVHVTYVFVVEKGCERIRKISMHERKGFTCEIELFLSIDWPIIY